jgi:hypothetical protein
MRKDPAKPASSGVPPQDEDSDEGAFDRFEDLARKLVKVPKSEIDEARKTER